MRDEMAIEALNAEYDRKWCEYSLGGMYDPDEERLLQKPKKRKKKKGEEDHV